MPHDIETGRGRRRGPLAATGVASLVLAWLAVFLVRHQLAVGLWIVAVAVVAICLLRSARAGKSAAVGTMLGAVVIVAEVAWLATDTHALWVTSAIAATALGFFLLVSAWTAPSTIATGRTTRASRVAAAVSAGLAAAIAVVVSAVMITVAASPAPLVRALHALGQSNSFEPGAQSGTSASVINEEGAIDGAGVINDIEYGSALPNSYLDIYIADNDPSVSRPTYVVVHGGGWVAGDKADGDPDADSMSAYFALGAGPMLDVGYNLVSVNYALAPGYRFPTQTIQLGEAMQFLEANGGEYGLDMSRVVLAGISAGGQIVGSYANVQTNPDYARELGIEPTMDRRALKAMVFDSAALDVGRAGAPQSPSPWNGFMFDISARSYLDTTDEAQVQQANVTDNVTADYPPSFIADGNTGSFPDQAAELSARLDRLGVRNRLNLYSTNEAMLSHGFMTTSSRWTEDYNRLKTEFLRESV